MTDPQRLEAMLRVSPVTAPLLARLPAFGLPSWYLGGGAVAQTVWNHLHGYPAGHGIKDCDVVYFDADDLSAESEQRVEQRIMGVCGDLAARIDVTNEARVHLWYGDKFGTPIEPYTSVEAAISTWPTTAASVGVRPRTRSELEVFAPFGLDDLFGMVVRPNKALVDRAVYEAKAARWRELWPRLTVVDW